MDFKAIKEKTAKLKEKSLKLADDMIDKSAKKLSSSNFTIDTKEKFDEFLEKSKTTSFTNKETNETKYFKHRVIVVFAEENSDFFKEALYMFPILYAKAFSQSIVIKLAKSKIDWLKLSTYKVKELPTLLVFEEEKLIKQIVWREKILKLVKTLNLDINKTIENI